jgi:tellurite resistance protein TerC
VVQFLRITYVWARRALIFLLGMTVLLIGVAMIVLPGPALAVIPAGLAILGVEFAFARRWLQRLRTTSTDLADQVLVRFRFRRK